MNDAIARKLAELGVDKWPDVATGGQRTTPPPPIDALEILPELAGTERTAVRLHPRYCANLPPDSNKLGGRFLWPADEDWPICPAHAAHCVAVLQLNATGFPELQFPPVTDVFQLFWCAVEPGWPDHYHAVWRRGADVTEIMNEAPAPVEAEHELVPVPCALFPERIQEYPPWHLLTPAQQERLVAWKPDESLQRVLDAYRYTSLADLYRWELSVCAGTKLGGYPDYQQSPIPKSMTRAGRPLPYLLTVSGFEYGMNEYCRWKPLEEQDDNDLAEPAFESLVAKLAWQSRALSPAQLFDADGRIHFFVDRDAPSWPIYEESDAS